MAAGIVGKALIVAWSFTLSNLGPTPQIINLGAAPTDSNYVPIEEVVNVNGVKTKDVAGLMVSFGTDPKNPIDVYGFPDPLIPAGNYHIRGNYLPSNMWGTSVVPADKNLYVEYSLPHAYPATDKPITIDVLAYPIN